MCDKGVYCCALVVDAVVMALRRVNCHNQSQCRGGVRWRPPIISDIPFRRLYAIRSARS